MLPSGCNANHVGTLKNTDAQAVLPKMQICLLWVGLQHVALSPSARESHMRLHLKTAV